MSLRVVALAIVGLLTPVDVHELPPPSLEGDPMALPAAVHAPDTYVPGVGWVCTHIDLQPHQYRFQCQ